MKKKVLTMLLAITMTASLAGCGLAATGPANSGSSAGSVSGSVSGILSTVCELSVGAAVSLTSSFPGRIIWITTIRRITTRSGIRRRHR